MPLANVSRVSSDNQRVIVLNKIGGTDDIIAAYREFESGIGFYVLRRSLVSDIFRYFLKESVSNYNYISSDVDIENKVLFIKNWKGSKDRLIPMPISLIDTLKQYLVQRRRLNKTSIYFFTSSKNDIWLSYDVLRRYISSLREYFVFLPHI